MLAHFVPLLDPGTHPDGSGTEFCSRMVVSDHKLMVSEPRTRPLGPHGPRAQGPGQGTRAQGPGQGTRAQGSLAPKVGHDPSVSSKSQTYFPEHFFAVLRARRYATGIRKAVVAFSHSMGLYRATAIDFGPFLTFSMFFCPNQGKLF